MPRFPKTPGYGCLAVWLLLWSVIVLFFDGFIATMFYQQLRALEFPTAPGVVTRSGIKTSDSSDGLSFRLDIAYEYEVAGRRYTGTRYSYGEMGTNTEAWHDIQNELPVGTNVAVAYDPHEPADSLLQPGPTGFHLALLWFLTPFNVVMIGGWLIFARRFRRAFDPTLRRCVVTTPSGYRVRLPSFARGLLFGGTLLAITFLSTFVWTIGYGFNPPVTVAAWGYLLTVLIATLVATRCRTLWLEIDDSSQILRLTAGASAPSEIPFRDVRDVAVVHEENKNTEGFWSHRYHCELVVAGAESHRRVATYYEEADAEALAAWLRERIGLTPSTSPTGSS